MKRNALGLLAKYPSPGRVKTRLARNMGEEGATQIYRSLAEKVFRQTKPEGGEFERVTFYAPFAAKADFENWLPGERLSAQKGTGLGNIMANALGDLFSEGAVKAVIAGVDIPDLDNVIIGQAFERLETVDIVIGPASDGGYYLVGMKSLHQRIFEHVSWSTARVFHETIKIIDELGLSYATVRTLSDVDRIEDIIGSRRRRC